MSHVTDVRLKIHDLDALKAAAEACGLELREGQKTYAWWGTFMNDSAAYGGHDPKTFGHSEHALRIPGDRPQNGSAGPWEIGVVKAADGDGYDLLYDSFGGAGSRLTQRVEPGANKLRREYAANVATAKATEKLSRHGWRIQREDQPNHSIKLKLRRR